MNYKLPKVTLLSKSDASDLSIFAGWKIMTDQNWPQTVIRIKDASMGSDFNGPIFTEEYEDVYREVAENRLKGVLEYVHFVFLIENVSRACQQQITRHRIGFSYSIQSLNMVNPGHFADDMNYYTPKRIREGLATDQEIFHGAMTTSQRAFQAMVRNGVRIEDARGVLPLNIFSPMTMACTFPGLLNLCRQRLCPATQEEFQLIAIQFKEIVTEHNSVLGEMLVPFCDDVQECLDPRSYCGRWPIKGQIPKSGA